MAKKKKYVWVEEEKIRINLVNVFSAVFFSAVSYLFIYLFFMGVNEINEINHQIISDDIIKYSVGFFMGLITVFILNYFKPYTETYYIKVKKPIEEVEKCV